MFEVDVLVDGKVYGTGIGTQQAGAAKAAARNALERLECVIDYIYSANDWR